jgi:hypothetical protein
MDSLSKSLYSVVSQAVDEFSQLVAKKYGVPKEEVLDLWNTNVSDELKTKEPVVKVVKKTPRSKASKPDSSLEQDTSSVCAYEFKKGKNIGTTCTAKSCPDTAYCRKHKTQEDKESSVVKKESVPKAKKETLVSKNKKATLKEKETSVVKKLNESKQQLVLVRNKYDNYEHVETHFVFDKSTKEVYGRQVESVVEPLTTEDIELCSKYNFKSRLPQTLTSNDDEDDVEEDDVEEEEEEEEEDDVEEDEDE